MDPIAHTFTGAALAAAGLRRATPLATAALIIGANAPDIDILALVEGNSAALAFRRGWTHGVLAIVVLPWMVAGLLLLWDRWVRVRRWPAADPARAGPLLMVSAIGVITHPVLDWLNNYGMRWLMPFDGTWFYGDALFIIDPWLWLALGGVACFAFSARPALIAVWAAFWLIASWLILTNPMVPVAARALWAAGLGAVIAARVFGFAAPARAPAVERSAQAALVLASIYITAGVLANIPARAEVRAELAARGLEPVEQVMIGPAPADPFAGTVIAATADAYYTGSWQWLRQPRFVLAPRSIPRGLDGPVPEAAAGTREARRFLVWSRFPYAEIEEDDDDGYAVRFSDARYAGTGGSGLVSGPTVYLDRNLAPRPPR